MQHKHLLVRLVEYFFPDQAPIGAEIGVDHADTTIYMLENCSNLRRLYAIDPYIKRDGRYAIVEEQLKPFSKCTLLRHTSHEAASMIPEELDFIFIDGDHSYDGVMSDLNDYVPKLKSGGLLTGHDWTSVRTDFGVVQAAGKYLNEHANLFQPLYSNDALRNMGFPEFKRGGWNDAAKRHLIHKKRPSAFPLWWLVKA